MIEIMIALAQSLRDQAPMIAQELGGLAAELKNTRWNGGL
jgi:hypothetical protein